MRTTRIPFGEARAQLRDLVCRAAYAGERITITRNGSPAAALVSLEDLRVLEALADPSTAVPEHLATVDESVVIRASRGMVWGVFSQHRYRVPWWGELMVDTYLHGEAIAEWDERTGRVVECDPGESITMVWGSGSAADSVEVRIGLSDAIALSDAAPGTVVRIQQEGAGPGADYWLERLAAWRDYAEALSSSSVQS
ncbi:type II toxin-antitoxin system prevent-host-death family antitoxin [Rhodococcus sp. SGAir0479]|uniref:type II toxin-antitoxin system prevent-host-death family antitoxin n=1 Tax=Rhodococcus sp. SGAir0479 TaxID=2567884 RepID=UPI0010CCBB28|nr:type II toxin-antitoxin system prevent-host-death family antitoxin [Rhodococcus sp. SGAir0479]QCQ92060.1 type II toxin-antitoxin system prevent-host-death family antitoxin [Rhodococcus sp. SGAir0479]